MPLLWVGSVLMLSLRRDAPVFAAILFLTAAAFLLNDARIPDDDAAQLAELLRKGLPNAYIGHWPAAIIGMKLYFYLSLPLTYAGLRLYLAGTPAAAALAWGGIFVLSPVGLRFLSAGSFLPLLNILVLGLLSFHLVDRRSLTSAPLLVATVLFHTASSAYILSGATALALLRGRPHLVLPGWFLFVLSPWIMPGSPVAYILPATPAVLPAFAAPIPLPAPSTDASLAGVLLYLGMGGTILLVWGVIAGGRLLIERKSFGARLIPLSVILLAGIVQSVTPLAVVPERGFRAVAVAAIIIASVLICQAIRSGEPYPLLRYGVASLLIGYAPVAFYDWTHLQ